MYAVPLKKALKGLVNVLSSLHKCEISGRTESPLSYGLRGDLLLGLEDGLRRLVRTGDVLGVRLVSE